MDLRPQNEDSPHSVEYFERAEVDENGLLFPVYLYDNLTSKIIIPPVTRGATIIDKNHFLQVKPALENNCKTIRRCFAVFQEGETMAFTAFFVSPHILATVGHALASDDTLGNPVKFVMSNIVSYIPNYRWDEDSQPMTLLHCGKEVEIPEREPQANTPITPCDFAFFHVHDYESPIWLTPCTQLPKVDEFIFTCQFNGALSSLVPYENIPNFSHNLDAVNSAFHVHRCSVSVGKVKAINETTISMNTSSVSGSSGAPCFGFNQINQFCAIYTGSIKLQGKFLPNVDNHALHVDHPHFMNAFCSVVLPDLVDKQSDGLKAYMAKHKH
jgi:hypothetical protein